MGRLYWDGESLAEDRVAAVAWWQRAARQKDREAQLWLGHALILGEGVAREAREWLAKAAEKGHAGARKRLAALPV
jgi:hypothetical protein